MAGSKPKLTVQLAPQLARAAQMRAVQLGKSVAELIEDALRAQLGIAALDEAQRLSTLSDDEALELANAEVHAARRQRSPGASVRPSP